MTRMDRHLTPEAHEDLRQKILEAQGSLVILPGGAPHYLCVFPSISDQNHHWFIPSLRHAF